MSLEQISDQLLRFVQSEFHDATVGPDTALPKNVLNSLGVFSVASFIENAFGVALDDSEMTIENFQSVRTLAKLVGEKRGV